MDHVDHGSHCQLCETGSLIEHSEQCKVKFNEWNLQLAITKEKTDQHESSNNAFMHMIFCKSMFLFLLCNSCYTIVMQQQNNVGPAYVWCIQRCFNFQSPDASTQRDTNPRYRCSVSSRHLMWAPCGMPVYIQPKYTIQKLLNKILALESYSYN